MASFVNFSNWVKRATQASSLLPQIVSPLGMGNSASHHTPYFLEIVTSDIYSASYKIQSLVNLLQTSF